MSGYVKLKNIVYSTTVFEHHTADVYLPEAGEDHPFVILVHGGAFQAGSKEMYQAWGPYLAYNGIASMAVNYTLATPDKASYPLVIEDMEAAIQFAVKNASEWKINPLNIGFMGDSAGAYLGTLAAFGNGRSSAKIKFVICAYGVMDILRWADDTNASRSDFVVNKLFGKDAYTGKKLYESASPVHIIDEAVRNPLFDTSFFMIWGESDDVVKPEHQTLAFIQKLEQFKIPHQKYSVPELGHFWFTKNDEELDERLIPVLQDHIAPKVIEFIKTTVNKNRKNDPNA